MPIFGLSKRSHLYSTCPTQNNWYKILKLAPKILQTVHDPMPPVPRNLDTLGIIYDCFTRNTFLRLVNRTSQIPYLTQGVSTNLIWNKIWNFNHRYNYNPCKLPPDFRVWNVTEIFLWRKYQNDSFQDDSRTLSCTGCISESIRPQELNF